MDTKQNEVENINEGAAVPEHASSEEIRQNIRGTRRGMDETLDELGERLHPRHLLEDVVDLFRGREGASNNQLARTSRDVGRTVSRVVREHPLPALLVGAGVAWWIIDAVSDGDEYYENGDHDYRDQSHRARSGREVAAALPKDENWDYNPNWRPTASPSYAAPIADDTGEVGAAEQSTIGKAGEKVKDAASAVGDKVSDAASTVGDTFRQGGRAIGSAASASWERSKRSLQDYSDRGARTVTRQAGILKDRFSVASEEYPLAIGGVSLAAGLLIGLLLPHSQKEDEWMGEASDQVKDEARELGEQTIQKAQSVVTQTAAAAIEEAEAHGVTPENVVDKASQIGAEAIRAGQESIRQEGNGPTQQSENSALIAEKPAGDA